MGTVIDSMIEAERPDPPSDATGATPTRASEQAANPAAPVMQLEKGDIEMWCQVAQVVLLFLIWREVTA